MGIPSIYVLIQRYINTKFFATKKDKSRDNEGQKGRKMSLAKNIGYLNNQFVIPYTNFL
jgi:hypothetical protein